MKRYLLYSCATHGLFLSGALLFGALFSRPSKTYYSIDLLTSMPSGSPGAAAPLVVEKESTPTPPAPVVHETPKSIFQDALKILDKKKKTPPVVAKKKTVTATAKVNAKSAARALAIANQVGIGSRPSAAASDSGTDSGGGGGGGSGVGVVAEGGTAFPYPWYLKAIAQQLDKHWKPPQEFQADTVAVIVFVIQRDGQVTDSKVEQSSSDSMFDQLALRAVLYSAPLPPLPTGFPDETLRVHMKFVGKHS